MLYIAFDQATSTTGYSVFKDRELINSGKFTKEGEEFTKILQQQDEVLKIISSFVLQYPNDKLKVILEDIQFQNSAGVTTFKKLAHLQGALVASIMREFPSAEIDLILASSWKAFAEIKGKNRTEQKKNTQSKVFELFNKKVTQDESDAIMIGYCSSHRELNWN